MTSTRPFIATQFHGQIGNQLFIASTVLAYSWDYHTDAYFPEMNTNKNRNAYNRDKLFFRLNPANPPRPCRYFFRESIYYSTERIPFREDLLISGYFQSWRHFHHHRVKLLETFAPSETIMNDLRNTYGDLLEHPKTVGVHVRTSGINHHRANSQPFLGFEYYETAMNAFPNDSIFVIFSDRIRWCRKHFSEQFKDKQLIFAEGKGYYGLEDLFFMSKCKHNIICNSTFSWWGAYLNQNPDQRVIVPDKWLSEVPYPNPFQDLYLPRWVGVPYVLHPYPEDMYAYDESSQSCDPVAWN